MANKNNQRIERDSLGECGLTADALYGVHTARAIENFPLSHRRVNPTLIHAYGAVKLACTRTNRTLNDLGAKVGQAIEQACEEMMRGKLDEHILVDALQGGAGTSLNMNVNEVLANRALELLGKSPGDYETVDPLAHVNLHQSTNDTFPTAIRVAAIDLIQQLEPEIVALQEAFQAKEQAFAHVVKIGRTQLQDAVLTTLGREMSAYAEAIARDRWRMYKCVERLRVANLGGTAIGTGLGAPRDYIFRVVDELRAITNMNLARAENLIDTTQNYDVFVEVSGILKAHAVNLLKIATDLRIMASGPEGGLGEIVLPKLQAGSSIMPSKVNPVIPEAISQAAIAVLGNDQTIATASAMGNLELNAFAPLIADKLLESLNLLTRACHILRTHCVENMQANQARCRQHVENSTATLTALIGRIPYDALERIADEATNSGDSIKDIIIGQGLLASDEFDRLTSAESVTRLGTPRKGKN